MRTFDVITVTYNSSHILRRFMDVLRSEPSPRLGELFVVDSGSRDVDESRDITNLYGARFIAVAENVGYGKGSNIGAREATSDWLVFVNPDVEASFAALASLCALSEEAELDSSGPRVTTLDGQDMITWGAAGLAPWRRRRVLEERRSGALLAETVSGCCMAVRSDVFRKLSGFDEHFFMFSEELDLHRRIWNKGGRVGVVDAVRVRTPGGASSSGVTARWRLVERCVGHVRFLAKHYGRMDAVAGIVFHTAQILWSEGFKPRTDSLRQFAKSLRRADR